MSKSSKIWLAIIVATVSVACLLPQTGWLARLQLGTSLRIPIYDNSLGSLAPSLGNQEWKRDRKSRGFLNAKDWATSRANDYEAQIGARSAFPEEFAQDASWTNEDVALVLDGSYPSRTVRAAWPLIQRSSPHPAVVCYLLRQMGLALHIRRDVDEKNHLIVKVRDPENTPYWAKRGWESFRSVAELGERLEPNNAFFTTMYALYLADAGDEPGMLRALAAAADKPDWNEYLQAEVVGQWDMERAIYGDQSHRRMVSTCASQLFPHYSELRRLARLAILSARQREARGDLASGLKIRTDVARVGSKMMVQGTSLVTSLLGGALVSMSAVQIGDTPEPVYPDDMSTDQKVALRQNTFLTHVNTVGSASLASWFQSNYDAVKSVKTDKFESTIETRMRQGCLWWFACLGLLSCAACTAVAGTISAILLQAACVSQSSPLQREIKQGLRLCILLAFAWLSLSTHETYSDIAPLPQWAITIGLSGVAIWYFTRIKPICAAYAMGWIVAGYGLYTLASWQMLAILSYVPTTTYLCGGGVEVDYQFGCVGAAFICAIACVLAIMSWRLRVPASVGVVRSMRSLALPMAAIGVLVWFPILCLTARFEANANSELRAEVQHEGRALARRAGVEWPRENPFPRSR